MRQRALVFASATGLLTALVTGCRHPAHPASSDVTLVYPPTRQTNQIDDYHGVKVADPYRWLEDDHSTETKAWVEAQNKVTFSYLE